MKDSQIVRPLKEASTVLTFSRNEFSSSTCKILEGSENPKVDCSYKLKENIKTCPENLMYITLKEAMNIKEDLRNVQIGAIFTTTYDKQVCDSSASALNNVFPPNCQTMFRAQQLDGGQCYVKNLIAVENSSFALKYYEQVGEGDFCQLEYTERKAVLLADAYPVEGDPVLVVYDICLLLRTST